MTINYILHLFIDSPLGAVVNRTLEWIDSFIKGIDWILLFKSNGFFVFAMVLVVCLFFINDLVFAYFSKKRIKHHHLTIRNNGNTPSLFLLRSIDLPKTISLRYRINGHPLIWLTRVNKAEKAAEEEQTVKKTDSRISSPPKSDHLIPDLKSPLPKAGEAVDTVRAGIGTVAKKAGFFASIFGTVSALLPKQNKTINEAQMSLKGLQQDSNQMSQMINTKVSNVERLGGQVGSLIPGSLKGAAKNTFDEASSAIKDGELTETDSDFGSVSFNDRSWSKNFSYEENDWFNNIGKVDEKDGSLNYAQTKVLQPGESMYIDVDIMNLSENMAPISHLYKIEVIQIPQTALNLSAPRQYVNGVVIFPKSSYLERLLPGLIVIGLGLLSIQLLAVISYWIF